jgi:hypothetical protein
MGDAVELNARYRPTPGATGTTRHLLVILPLPFIRPYIGSLCPQPPVPISSPIPQPTPLSPFLSCIYQSTRHQFFFSSLFTSSTHELYVHLRTQAGPTTHDSTACRRTHTIVYAPISSSVSYYITSSISNNSFVPSHAPQSDLATSHSCTSSQPRAMGRCTQR